ncbi:MAG: NAD(P)-dependent oxidoreductase, partial [Desulfobulbaceae bacterium]|nr:NAD(P)-dependent oxidoreductase [Desulfobulbaceae bacterium]
YDVDPVTLRTSVEWIFAAGDAVAGPQTVAKAVAGAKTASESIARFLEGKDLRAGREPESC